MAEPSQRRNDFSVGSIPRTIVILGLPMIGAQIINALYSIVDRAYIGRIQGVGAMALTGVGLTFPIIMIVTAFTNLCGMGGAPLCSIARGEGRNDYAERIMGTALTMLIIFGAVLFVFAQLYMEPVLWLFGASANTAGYATEYLRVYLLGTPFVMLALGMNPYINAQGFARTGMLTVLVGAVANIILDPIFIFVLGMGVKGAALATVLSQMLCAVWALRFLLSGKPILRIRRKNLRVDFTIAKKICALGVSNFTMALTESVIQVAFNTTLRAYGGDLAIGSMTIVSSLRQLILMPLSGISGGAQPVIGYNYGAERPDRVRESVKFLLKAGLCYAALCWTLFQLAPDLLVRIFNNDPRMLEAAVPAVKVYFSMFFLMSFQMAGQNSFVAMGRAKQATFFSLLRKVFIVTPVALILPRVTGLGAMGVFIAEPVSDIIGPIACFTTFYFTVYRRLETLIEEKKAALAGKELGHA